jgi:hypothetical protein
MLADQIFDEKLFGADRKADAIMGARRAGTLLSAAWPSFDRSSADDPNDPAGSRAGHLEWTTAAKYWAESCDCVHRC